MKEGSQRLLELYTKRLNSLLTDEEAVELQVLLDDKDAERSLSPMLYEGWKNVTLQDKVSGMGAEKIADLLSSLPLSAEDEIETHMVPVRRLHRIHLRRNWGWVAAAMVILLGIGTYSRLHNGSRKTLTDVAKQTVTDIAPGKAGAILTLADGTKVVLDSLGNGTIPTQGGAAVVLKNNELSYDVTGAIAGNTVYNTMSTPKGRQFQITLPDGTRVWLNSESSIRFPTVFAGGQRTVEVTGEAYFEVAKDAAVPFRVNINDRAEVEVLGTHFNINAYENESRINTTLLEGSVKVKRQREMTMLKPGQQAQIANVLPSNGGIGPGSIRVIHKANIDKVMAWKNGLFDFEDATLEEVMRQLERWYDIQVVYETGVPETRFYGQINKQNSLQELMHILEKNEVHLRLESGNKLVVSN
jgi:transmembrane sensor